MLSSLKAATMADLTEQQFLSEDRTLPVAMQVRLIREADEEFPNNPFTVRTIQCSRVGFVFRSGDVADALAELKLS